MQQTIRGARKPIVVDLLIAVALASLLMTGLRVALKEGPDGLGFAALIGILMVATLYGMDAVVEMRWGWVGSSAVTDLFHVLLVLGSMAGIGVLAVSCPLAVCMAIAVEGLLRLCSSSWI